MLAIATIVGLAFLSANQQPQPMLEPESRDLGDEADETKLDDVFVYDVVTRFNESLVGNIDAIDTAVTAVLAGNVAVAIFAMDKIRELHRVEECWANGLLAGSVLACVCAYVIGFPAGASKRDGVSPRFFIPDVLARQSAAISTAIEAVIRAGEINLSVRLWKRGLVVAAILLLLAGGVVVALARLGSNLIG
jgi:hypothetical protein